MFLEEALNNPPSYYFDLALKIWNEEKLPKWVYHRGLTDRAKGQLKKMLEFFGEDEFEIAVRAAISHAKKEDFWKNFDCSFVNLFSNDKGIEYAERELNDAPKLVVGGLYRLSGKPGWVARITGQQSAGYVCTIANVGDVEATRQDDVVIPSFEIGERIHEKSKN